VDATTLQLLAWCAAFWAALIGFAARQERVCHPARFLLGLALGAALAHLGWALLNPALVRAQPRILLSPLGFTELLVPLGLLAAAPCCARSGARTRFLSAALGALPPALATARLGCLAAGCCAGTPSTLPWAIALKGGPRLHPVALYEIAALVALSLATRRADPRSIPAAVLAGFGAIRLALEPLRAPPPLGAPLVPPALLALGWIALGALAWRAGRKWPPEAAGAAAMRRAAPAASPRSRRSRRC